MRNLERRAGALGSRAGHIPALRLSHHPRAEGEAARGCGGARTRLSAATGARECVETGAGG